ncbi:hypothetical protein E1301_Tti019038 [Triplophysa tibetana]|uniref:DDE Tnp4 domain-containing protein n=1 Tax=Triplophysa tibetana TaxID=1572043 RepID=A0A5A9PME7_9TELE|nr:hypothetical protein E1301_Tti019038 [Triplophysa tibetana]
MESAKRHLAVAVAILCSDTKQKKKKKRVWMRTWLGRRGQLGLSVLQRELELEDRSGFKELLRKTSDEFDILLERVEPLITRQNTKMRRAITAKESLSLTLRFLATGETYKSLSFQFRIGATTLSEIVNRTCAALHQVLKDDFLKTPTKEEEWRAISNNFMEKWQFPHCLDALDGKHIYIQPPAHSGSIWHNYKSRFSVLMMAVVDANYKFLYISVGTQGRVSDAGLFAHSDLKKALDQGLLNVPPPERLISSDVVLPYLFVGDEAYPLRTDLMKPYPFRQLDHSQRIFNYRLSRARRVVENAFGILANRFRVFRSTILLHPDSVTKITLASACLHNFLCECRSEAYIPSALADCEDADHRIHEGAWRRDGVWAMQCMQAGRARNPTLTAKQQRDLLRDYFVSPAGQVPWQDNHV